MSGIKAGDLVMVVRPLPCCGHAKHIGRTFVVGHVARLMGKCPNCKEWFSAVDCAMEVEENVGMLVQCLIRIDPPALPESIDTEREVTA